MFKKIDRKKYENILTWYLMATFVLGLIGSVYFVLYQNDAEIHKMNCISSKLYYIRELINLCKECDQDICNGYSILFTEECSGIYYNDTMNSIKSSQTCSYYNILYIILQFICIHLTVSTINRISQQNLQDLGISKKSSSMSIIKN